MVEFFYKFILEKFDGIKRCNDIIFL